MDNMPKIWSNGHIFAPRQTLHLFFMFFFSGNASFVVGDGTKIRLWEDLDWDDQFSYS